METNAYHPIIVCFTKLPKITHNKITLGLQTISFNHVFNV